MFELTINEQVYPFNFGMGFMREINRKVKQPIDGLANVEKNIGLRYTLAGVIDGDLEDLVEVLDAANKGMKPRVTRDLLDSLIDNEETDIDKLFEEVVDFLKNANATKKTMLALLEMAEKERAKAEANQ